MHPQGLLFSQCDRNRAEQSHNITHVTGDHMDSKVYTELEVMPRVNKILESGSNFEYRFIRDYRELAAVVRVLKAMGKKIVLTKGVYDLLHAGHARYIAQARSHGDILIISVDTDELTRKRKGDGRPIVSQDERLEMLVHMRYTDIVILRDVTNREQEDVEIIKPAILVTSKTTADYPDETKEMLRNTLGVEIVTLEPQAETSTTARVRKLMIDGGRDLADQIVAFVHKFLGQKGG